MRRTSLTVKWLGEGAVVPLAVDGKVTGNDLNLQIRQWCTTRGKGVVTPGMSSSSSSGLPRFPKDLRPDHSLWLTVVIVSYEKLRSLTEHLGETAIGLLLADEGHRLKNSSEPIFLSPSFLSSWTTKLTTDICQFYSQWYLHCFDEDQL